MRAFTRITSIVASMPIANIDTDMIIPKQYLKTIKRTGLGKYLFADMRYDENGKPNANFILNQDPYKSAKILVAEENFGCGSSREHAPWALVDFGIQVIIAPSFADIFYGNAFKNGMLLIKLSRADIVKITSNQQPITVDLVSQTIQTEQEVIPFSIEEFRRQALLTGMDEIGETLKFADQITAFEAQQKQQQPWLY
jgi:3-isopropylmalate/(R)-2-methylmalate dehydratase small subunit